MVEVEPMAGKEGGSNTRIHDICGSGARVELGGILGREYSVQPTQPSDRRGGVDPSVIEEMEVQLDGATTHEWLEIDPQERRMEQHGEAGVSSNRLADITGDGRIRMQHKDETTRDYRHMPNQGSSIPNVGEPEQCPNLQFRSTCSSACAPSDLHALDCHQAEKNGVLSRVSEKGQHGSNLQGRRGGFGSVKLTNKRYTNNLCATKPNACSLAKPGRTFPTATCGNQLRAPLAEAHHAGRSRPYDPAFAIADPCISAQRP